MNTKAAQVFRDSVRKIAERDGSTLSAVMAGVVKTVDTETNTCGVVLDCGAEGLVLEGVTLNVVDSNAMGLVLIPKEGAKCLVLTVDGGGRWELVKATQYGSIAYVTENSSMKMSDSGLKYAVDGLKLTAGGSKLDVLYDGGAHLTMEGGLFTIKNGAGNLKQILGDFMDHVSAAVVVVGGSPGSIDPATQLILAADKAALEGLLG